MAIVNKFNINKQQVTLDADIIENMSANDVSYNDSFKYDENTVGDKLAELSKQAKQGIYDVTANNDGVTFASLSALLSSENLSTLIPVGVRCGGMVIRFVKSSDNKYVQYRLMTTTFSINPIDWIDSENNKEVQILVDDTQVNPTQKDLIFERYYDVSSLIVGTEVLVTNMSYNGWYGFSPITIKKGWKFNITGNGYDNYRLFYLIDSNNVLRMVADNGNVSGTYTATHDGLLYVNSRYAIPTLNIYNLVKTFINELCDIEAEIHESFDDEKQERKDADLELTKAISKGYTAQNSLNGTYPSMYGRGIIFDKLFTQGTIINKFKFVIKEESGLQIHIYIFIKNENSFTVLKDLLNCGELQPGEHSYTLDYNCPIDCYIGIYNSGNNLFVEQSGEHTYNSYRITYDDLVENSTITPVLFNYYPKYSFEYKSGYFDFQTINNDVAQNTTDINKLNNDNNKLRKNKSVLFDRQYSFDGELHLLTNCTLDSYNKVIFGTGDSYYVYYKRFMSDQRKCVYEIDIPSSSTPIIRIGALNTRIATDHLYSTCCEINRSTNKMIIYKGGASNGITSLTPLVSEDIVNTVNSTKLLIEIERNRKITTLRVYDYYTRAYDVVTFDGNNTLFRDGAGNHRPYYFLYTDTVGLKLSIFGVYDVALVHLGDSLSESNGRCDTSVIGYNWIEQIMELISWNGSIVAQSGANISDVLAALNNEVQYIKPKTVSVMIGTNHGATISQYQDIIAWCAARGIELIICNIPMTYGRQSTDVNSAEYIAEELDSLHIQVVRMNNATAIDGNPANGSDLVAFNGDKLHTNQLGNNHMYERFLMDAPQIIYFSR